MANELKDIVTKMRLEFFGPTPEMQQQISACEDINYRRVLQQKFNNMQAVKKMQVRLQQDAKKTIAIPAKPIVKPVAAADKSAAALEELLEIAKYPKGDSPRHWNQIAQDMKERAKRKNGFIDGIHKAIKDLEGYRITT